MFSEGETIYASKDNLYVTTTPWMPQQWDQQGQGGEVGHAGVGLKRMAGKGGDEQADLAHQGQRGRDSLSGVVAPDRPAAPGQGGQQHRSASQRRDRATRHHGGGRGDQNQRRDTGQHQMAAELPLGLDTVEFNEVAHG